VVSASICFDSMKVSRICFVISNPSTSSIGTPALYSKNFSGNVLITSCENEWIVETVTL